VTEARIATLLRSVNSYYSNRIEGQQTHPRDIERALKKNFSKEPKKARLQRLAVAHIAAQEDMERWLAEAPDQPYSARSSWRGSTGVSTAVSRRRIASRSKATR
jgi:Fic family protein